MFRVADMNFGLVLAADGKTPDPSKAQDPRPKTQDPRPKTTCTRKTKVWIVIVFLLKKRTTIASLISHFLITISVLIVYRFVYCSSGIHSIHGILVLRYNPRAVFVGE